MAENQPHPIDAIASEHSTEIDRVYPPMTWTALWSTGDNLPLLAGCPEELRRAFRGCPDYYDAGLWLFSDDGPRRRVVSDRLGREWHGKTVRAWTGREAEARILAMTSGFPVRNGIHDDEHGRAYMMCQAERYKAPPQPAAVEVTEAMIHAAEEAFLSEAQRHNRMHDPFACWESAIRAALAAMNEKGENDA